MVRWTDHLDMTIAVDLDVKNQNKNKTTYSNALDFVTRCSIR